MISIFESSPRGPLFSYKSPLSFHGYAYNLHYKINLKTLKIDLKFNSFSISILFNRSYKMLFDYLVMCNWIKIMSSVVPTKQK